MHREVWKTLLWGTIPTAIIGLIILLATLFPLVVKALFILIMVGAGVLFFLYMGGTLMRDLFDKDYGNDRYYY